MASIGSINMDAVKAIAKVEINITVKRTNEARFRIWIACLLIRLAAVIIGAKGVNIMHEEE